MKYLILGTALALALPLTNGIGPASAQEIRFSLGDRGHWHGHRHRHGNAYAYVPDCRVVVKKRINRFGERVTVRKRICD
jgi:hypothetical protein